MLLIRIDVGCESCTRTDTSDLNMSDMSSNLELGMKACDVRAVVWKHFTDWITGILENLYAGLQGNKKKKKRNPKNHLNDITQFILSNSL